MSRHTAKQTIYNAGIYVRLSQEDMRAGESLSIENQKLILTKYVKEQGWNLIDIYVDDGYSGTSFDRPGVKRLLDDAKNGVINLILCKDLSRFGRNYIQVGQYIDYIFPTYNIRFIALNDNVDTANKDTSAMDMMPIVNLFNEWHSSSTSRKIKAVIAANAKAGKYRATAAPYGYVKSDTENRLPIPDEPAASVVRRIFEMRSKGTSPRHIADALNAEKIPIPSDYYYAKLGKPNPRKTARLWSTDRIKQILRNPTYLGHHQEHPQDVEEYIRRLKKYADVPELTREMALELIEYVTIYEYAADRPRDIHIYYKLLDKPLPDKLRLGTLGVRKNDETA